MSCFDNNINRNIIFNDVQFGTSCTLKLCNWRCIMNYHAACAIAAEARDNDPLFCELKAEGLNQETINLWGLICSFDLTRETLLLVSPDRSFNYDSEHVSEMEREYRKFMFLRIMHPEEKLPMSQEVDDFWHAHVMHTRCYQDFIDQCANGVFIHHRPTVCDEENMAMMPAYLQGTLERYRQYFGEPPEKFWKKDPDTPCCYC